jgi:hypothetical protein
MDFAFTSLARLVLAVDDVKRLDLQAIIGVRVWAMVWAMVRTVTGHRESKRLLEQRATTVITGDSEESNSKRIDIF